MRRRKLFQAVAFKFHAIFQRITNIRNESVTRTTLCNFLFLVNDCARELRAQAWNGDDHHVNNVIVNDDNVNDVSDLGINLNR